ncbi:MAG: DUF4400 domain-containing protein [Piscinibacter sp.]|nr:DUF4400 domain-containing protein [Piscinibacter sp.]
MIRLVAVTSPLVVLALVLYLPSAHPPEHFLAQLRLEHAAAADAWGPIPAERMLERALGAQDATRQPALPPEATNASTAAPFDTAVAREMATVNRRLLDNSYFRAVEALLLLALFRLSMIVEWLPWLVAFTIAALVDGYVVRAVRSREFVQHDPELFALAICAAIVVACGAVIASVVPAMVHPTLLPSVPLVISALAACALASFHRRAP